MSSENPDTRNRILNATWKLMEANPRKEVRMTDIAKASGISRQAVYLHFPNRADLLIATTRYLDEVTGIDTRLGDWEKAGTGVEKIDAYIMCWGGYIPEVHGVAKALLAMKDADDAANAAWNERMQAVRSFCQIAVEALHADGDLDPAYSIEQATDVLWTLLSIRNWEQFTFECGWSQETYLKRMKDMYRRLLLA